MKTFDNKGNHFFIEIIPEINNEGAWKGKYQMAIQARRLNIDDDSFFALEQLCQMVCASLALMEEDTVYRDKIDSYLHSPTPDKNINIVTKDRVDKISDNVITINFNDDTTSGSV